MENWKNLIQVAPLYKLLAHFVSFSMNEKNDVLYALAINAMKLTNDKEQFAILFINSIKGSILRHVNTHSLFQKNSLIHVFIDY